MWNWTVVSCIFEILQGFCRVNWPFLAAGSDVVSMKCKADRVDGGYVLNGNKMWCTNGPVAQTLVCFFKFLCIFPWFLHWLCSCLICL